MINKRKLLGAIIALGFVVILISAVCSTGAWNIYGEATPVPVGLNGEGNLDTYSLNYQLFEVWGPIILCLGAVMFGAIIAGVAISKEDNKEKKKEGEE